MSQQKCLHAFNPEPYLQIETILVLRKKDGKFTISNFYYRKKKRTDWCSTWENGKHIKVKVGKEKKRICEACGTKGKTEWAHIIPSSHKLFIELCKPCHNIYDGI